MLLNNPYGLPDFKILALTKLKTLVEDKITVTTSNFDCVKMVSILNSQSSDLKHGEYLWQPLWSYHSFDEISSEIERQI